MIFYYKGIYITLVNIGEPPQLTHGWIVRALPSLGIKGNIIIETFFVLMGYLRGECF